MRTRRWRRLRPRGERPAARFGHNLLAEPAGTLLVFGGQAGSRFFGDLWRYDPAANDWTLLRPAARSLATAPARRSGRGGDAWITHGFTTDGRFDDTWTLAGGALADRSAAAARPLRRCLVQSALAGGGLFCSAGSPTRCRIATTCGASTRHDRVARAAPGAAAESAQPLRGRADCARLVHPRRRRAAGELSDLWRYDFAAGAFRRLGGRGPVGTLGRALAAAGSPGSCCSAA